MSGLHIPESARRQNEMVRRARAMVAAGGTPASLIEDYDAWAAVVLRGVPRHVKEYCLGYFKAKLESKFYSEKEGG